MSFQTAGWVPGPVPERIKLNVSLTFLSYSHKKKPQNPKPASSGWSMQIVVSGRRYKIRNEGNSKFKDRNSM